MPSRRHSSAMLSSPRIPDRTMRIFSSAENCRRPTRRISFTTCCAGSFDPLEIVDDRYDHGSLLITSQVPVNRWHEVIGDPTLADAILDRIVHRAHRTELKGPSLRRHLVTGESSAA